MDLHVVGCFVPEVLPEPFGAADPAIIHSDFDRTAALAGADLLIANNSRLSLDVGYRGEFGKLGKSQDLHATIKVAF